MAEIKKGGQRFIPLKKPTKKGILGDIFFILLQKLFFSFKKETECKIKIKDNINKAENKIKFKNSLLIFSAKNPIKAPKLK